MLNSQPLFGSISQLVLTATVGLLVLFCGISTNVASAKGSPRFRYFLGALTGATLISFSSVWLLYEVGNAGLHYVRGVTGSQDPAQEAIDYSIHYIQRSHFVLIGLAGLLFMVISLLIRKPRAGNI
jgi:hypothetical protein